MDFFTRTKMAIKAAVSAFNLTYTDPEREQSSNKFIPYGSIYKQRLAWYDNSIFDISNSDWELLKKNYNIYRKVRSLKNPVGAVCDFFADNVYPGGLTPDGKPFPDGSQTAMPFPNDTDETLMAAIAQIWAWGNWDIGKSTHVRDCGIYGDNFIEIIDDTARGKVYYKETYPGFVTDLTLDPQGNVKAYTLEYSSTDALGKTYKYKKVVTKEAFTEYRDNVTVAEWENIYTFVPARWFNHSGGAGIVHGPPAFRAFIPLMELNSKMSQVSDDIGKKFLAPWLMTNVEDPESVTELFNNLEQDNKAKRSLEGPNSASGDLTYIMTVPNDSKVLTLAGNLDIGSALEFIKLINDEVDSRNPEITYWEKLRDMGEVTGPAADRLSGDVKGRLQRAQSTYDKGNIALAQMSVAIAGMRAKEGREGWRNKTKQQQKFTNYDLDSYVAGLLDFSFAARPLIQSTPKEKSDEKKSFFDAVGAGVDAKIPTEVVLKDMGWDDAKITELGAGQRAEMARIQTAQQLAQADTIPTQLPEGRVQ